MASDVNAIQETILYIWQFSTSGHTPDELDGLYGDSFRQILAGKNRIICQVRDDTILIHLVVDVRLDLPSLLHRVHFG